MISDCELLGHPLLVDGVECPCGQHKTEPLEPAPRATFHHEVGVWWAGIPRLNFGAPATTCDHPPRSASPL